MVLYEVSGISVMLKPLYLVLALGTILVIGFTATWLSIIIAYEANVWVRWVMVIILWAVATMIAYMLAGVILKAGIIANITLGR